MQMIASKIGIASCITIAKQGMKLSLERKIPENFWKF